MRKLLVLVATTAGLLSTLLSGPANASSFNGTSGTVGCSRGYVTIRDKAVTSNFNCYGSVFIPDGVTSISPSAFSGADTLMSVGLPYSLTSIGDSAFSDATQLESLMFLSGSNLETIGDSAFSNTAFTYITIPSTVRSIGDSAYYGTAAISLTFADGSQLETIGPSAFYGATRLSSVAIPSSVTSIGTYAFYGTTKLQTLTFGANSKLKTIGERAFQNASSLSSVEIPASVTTIDDLAFYGASSLGSLTFVDDSKLRFIGWCAFTGATGITSLTIPSSVTYIDSFAFADITELESLIFLPDSKLEYINPYSFQNASSLESVTIPASVTYLGYNAFEGATSLASVSFENWSRLESIGSEAFFNARRLTEISIPASVKTIGNSAFSCEWYYECTLTSVTFGDRSALEYIGPSAFFGANEIESITIPARVREIGDVAFAGASSLTDIYFLGNAPTIGIRVFDGIATGADAHIKSTATGFNSIGSTWHGLTLQDGVYEVLYNSKSGSSVSPDGYLAGRSFSEPYAPYRSGYTFTGWSLTDQGMAISFPYAPAEPANLTLYAQWMVNTYTVNYAYNLATGGNSQGSGTYTTGGTEITLPSPTRSNHLFYGWFQDERLLWWAGGPGSRFAPSGDALELNLYAKWIPIPTTSTYSPPTVTAPSVDLAAQAAATDLASRTITTKSRFSINSLAARVGVQAVSPRAKITFSVSKSSKKVCSKSGSKLKTLTKGNCVITFTVQEPKPKKGKKPKAVKTVKSFVVQ